MKKIVVILLIAVLVALSVSSCNQKTCPAYKNQFASVERIG